MNTVDLHTDNTAYRVIIGAGGVGKTTLLKSLAKGQKACLSVRPSAIRCDTEIRRAFREMSSDAREDVLDDLTNLLGVSYLSLHDPKNPVTLIRHDKREIPLVMAGSSTLQILWVVSQCWLNSHSFIDNVDLYLHPQAARALMYAMARWLKIANHKATVSVSNLLSVDGLPLQDPQVGLYTISQATNGTRMVFRVEVTEALMKAAESGLTVSRMWATGVIGGSNVWTL